MLSGNTSICFAEAIFRDPVVPILRQAVPFDAGCATTDPKYREIAGELEIAFVDDSQAGQREQWVHVLDAW